MTTMVTVKEITVYDVENLASKIAEKMPRFEVQPERFDEFGDFDEMFDFDIEFEVEGLKLSFTGKVRAQGYCKAFDKNDRWVAPSAELTQVNEIYEMFCWIDGEEVTIHNRYDLENKINEWL